MTSWFLRLVSAWLLANVCGSTAHAQVTFARAADTTTTIPNGSGSFDSFSPTPALSGATVVFRGTGDSQQEGIYAGNSASLTRVADLTTLIPGSSQPFSNFTSTLAVSGTTVGFVADEFVFGSYGVYTGTTSGGAITRIADQNTPIPNGFSTFIGFGAVAVSGDVVAFRGYRLAFTSQQDGIYAGTSSGGVLTRIVDTNTAIPSGTGTFGVGFGELAVSGTTIVYQWANAGAQKAGLYAGSNTGGSLTRVVDQTTNIPGGSGQFTAFSSPTVTDTRVAFRGAGSGQDGIYIGTTAGDQLAVVADLTSPIPGGVGLFTGFGAVSLSGEAVAFLGSGSGGQTGIYLRLADGEPLIKLIAVGDALDGRTLSTVDFASTGLDGDTLTFSASFTDGTEGIYLANFTPVPEPASVLGVVVVGVIVSRFVRRVRIRIEPSRTRRCT